MQIPRTGGGIARLLFLSFFLLFFPRTFLLLASCLFSSSRTRLYRFLGYKLLSGDRGKRVREKRNSHSRRRRHTNRGNAVIVREIYLRNPQVVGENFPSFWFCYFRSRCKVDFHISSSVLVQQKSLQNFA